MFLGIDSMVKNFNSKGWESSVCKSLEESPWVVAKRANSIRNEEEKKKPSGVKVKRKKTERTKEDHNISWKKNYKFSGQNYLTRLNSTMNFMFLHTVIFLLLFGSGKVESKSRNRTKSHDSTKSLKRSQKLKKEEPEIVKILVLLPEDERFLFREGLEMT